MGHEEGIRVCRKCGGANVFVYETNYGSFEKYVRRRIVCKDCGERYTTYEVTKEDFDNVKKARQIITYVKKVLEEMKK